MQHILDSFFFISALVHIQKKNEWRDESYQNEHRFTFANGHHHGITVEWKKSYHLKVWLNANRNLIFNPFLSLNAYGKKNLILNLLK